MQQNNVGKRLHDLMVSVAVMRQHPDASIYDRTWSRVIQTINPLRKRSRYCRYLKDSGLTQLEKDRLKQGKMVCRTKSEL